VKIHVQIIQELNLKSTKFFQTYYGESIVRGCDYIHSYGHEWRKYDWTTHGRVAYADLAEDIVDNLINW